MTGKHTGACSVRGNGNQNLRQFVFTVPFAQRYRIGFDRNLWTAVRKS